MSMKPSTGVYYDMDLISDFCRRNGLVLLVDANPLSPGRRFRYGKNGAWILVLTGSQKALALPPGLSVLVLGERAVERVKEHAVRSIYFDLKD